VERDAASVGNRALAVLGWCNSASLSEVGEYKRAMREQQAQKVVMKSRTRIGISLSIP
jgi:hypothetical protein